MHPPHRTESRPRAVPTVRFRHVSRINQAGFALVAVIWSLGLITLLGTAVIVGARYRTRVTSSVAAVAAASAAADSAINLGIMAASTKTPAKTVNFPLRCRMPGGESVIVTLEEEAGKVDLNAATPAILARLFTALTQDQSAGTRIAERIVQFRDPRDIRSKDSNPRSPRNKPEDAKKPGFATIMQLDEIAGISPRLFRAALPLVTVRSGRPEPVAEAASPALREALNLGQSPAAPIAAGSATGDVTIRSDVRAADGTRFIREALISLEQNGRPYVIREWRHGDIHPGAPAPALPSPDEGEESCFRIGGAVGT